jgi:hypothetical protein
MDKLECCIPRSLRNNTKQQKRFNSELFLIVDFF